MDGVYGRRSLVITPEHGSQSTLYKALSKQAKRDIFTILRTFLQVFGGVQLQTFISDWKA